MNKPIAIAADTEFTHFDKIGGDVIVTGLVEVLEDLTLGREAVFYSAPRGAKYFSKKAQEVHGISYFKATTFPKPDQSCLAMMHWMSEVKDLFPLQFINHGNGALDYRWLEQLFRNNGYEDKFWKMFCSDKEVINTIKLAKDNIVGLNNYKLNTVASYYDIELNHHDALSDARACAQIYCNIQRGIGLWTGKLDL